jgi:hypothetical protein
MAKGLRRMPLRSLELPPMKNVTVVAMANKMARTIWALTAHERAYQSGYVSRPCIGSHTRLVPTETSFGRNTESLRREHVNVRCRLAVGDLVAERGRVHARAS